MSNRSKTLQIETAQAVQEIYRPILRGYFSVFAAYYLVMLPFNYLDMNGMKGLSLLIACAIAATIGCVGSWLMRKPTQAGNVEASLLALNAAVVCNVLIALQIEFVAAKLSYFVIAAMLFALASLSLRQSMISIAFAGFAMASFVSKLEQSTFSAFAFLVFATAMASLAIAYFLRSAVTKIAEAKIAAESQLIDARALGEEMREKSLSDSLTLLPNRRAFFVALREAVRLSLANRKQGKTSTNVWLLLLDLDGFKNVNDVHGHLTGDALLKQVAGRLESFAGDNFHASRIGGDEFALIHANSCDSSELMAKCDELLAHISERYIIDGRTVKVSCSIGCKLIELGKSTQSQISNADYALMIAKKKGKNQAILFTEMLADEAREKQAIEQALRTCNLAEELDLVYQPQFDLRNNTIVRAEALARWTSPSVGSIEPQRFIKIAEESGLITGITLVVVGKAFAELNSWPSKVPLSINISSHDLISDTAVDEIISLSKSHDVDPGQIELEVTETAMMADFEKARTNLRKLSEHGFTIALDDFGTGYSNFSYLRALPINKLKVDKSFVDCPEDPMTEKVLASLAGMARVLGVHCLFEGIEDEIDLLMAKRAGAESVQGYLFGKPMSSAELMTLVSNPEESEEAPRAIA